MDIKINITTPMTLNERFRNLNLKSLSEDIEPELTLDTLLPPRPLVDEDNFDDDHVEMFDKQLLEDELDKIHEEIGLYHIYC